MSTLGTPGSANDCGMSLSPGHSQGKTLSNGGTNLNPRFEAPSILLRNGISCAVWGEDALRHYGVRTVCFDLFVLVDDSEAAAQCLEGNGYYHAAPNPRYQVVPELYVLPRFKKILVDGVEGRGTTCIALLAARNCCYSLLPADTIRDLITPLHLLIDSIIDAWMDVATVDYAMHLAGHLPYLRNSNPKAKDPLFAKELKPGHQEYSLRSLWYDSGGKREVETITRFFSCNDVNMVLFLSYTLYSMSPILNASSTHVIHWRLSILQGSEWPCLVKQKYWYVKLREGLTGEIALRSRRGDGD